MFIYTINDIVGAFVMGIALLFCGVWFLMYIAESIGDWWKRRK